MNKWWWVLIGVVIVLTLVFCIPKVSQLIQELSIDKSTTSAVDTLKDGLKDYTNGGFDFEEITECLEKESCPTADNQIVELHVDNWSVESQNIGVVIWYETTKNGKKIYPNLLFKRVNGQLVLDGFVNAYLIVPYSNNFWGYAQYKLDSAKWETDFYSKPDYEYYKSSSGHDRYQNVASISDTKVFYWKNYQHNRNSVNPSNNEYKKCANYVANKMCEIIEEYFLKINSLYFISDTTDSVNVGEDIYIQFNSFYNWLYQHLKDEHGVIYSNTEKIINVNKYYYNQIPESERINYPITDEDKVGALANLEYYFAYKCDIYFDLQYASKSYKGLFAKINDSIVDETIKYDKQESEYSKVQLKLKNTNSAVVSEIPIVDNPVTINFVNGSESKNVLIDSVDKLKNGVNLIFEKNKRYTYSIDSAILLFDSNSGSINITTDNGVITFDYVYTPNSLAFYVGLNSIGEIDWSAVNLAITPVKIMFSTGTIITFDDNSEFDELKPCLVTIDSGETTCSIDYTILSDGLEFASTSGTIQVSSTQRYHYFNCAGKYQSSLNIISYGKINEMSIGNIQVMFYSDYYETYLKDVTTIEVVIYDENYVMTSLECSSVIGLVGGYRVYTFLIRPSENEYLLENGQSFYAQIKITIDNVIYMSSIYSLTYDINGDYSYLVESIEFKE